MHEDFGNFRASATVTADGSGQVFLGTWHIAIILADGSTRMLREGPMGIDFPSKVAAEEATMKFAASQARELHESNSISTFDSYR
ncbi:hypothetical protein ISP17_13470 [Dyella ginsengisoli]|uniref:Uncharacterized protein n=1 Tax=Dyella ginsengisoli TaxID=363848 RepID=A0ABW8JV20_9GAMM